METPYIYMTMSRTLLCSALNPNLLHSLFSLRPRLGPRLDCPSCGGVNSYIYRVCVAVRARFSRINMSFLLIFYVFLFNLVDTSGFEMC